MNEPLGLGSRLSVNEQQLHEHCELWSTLDTSCVLQSTQNKPGKELWGQGSFVHGDSPGKNTEVDSHGIFLTQESS